MHRILCNFLMFCGIFFVCFSYLLGMENTIELHVSMDAPSSWLYGWSTNNTYVHEVPSDTISAFGLLSNDSCEVGCAFGSTVNVEFSKKIMYDISGFNVGRGEVKNALSFLFSPDETKAPITLAEEAGVIIYFANYFDGIQKGLNTDFWSNPHVEHYIGAVCDRVKKSCIASDASYAHLGAILIAVQQDHRSIIKNIALKNGFLPWLYNRIYSSPELSTVSFEDTIKDGVLVTKLTDCSWCKSPELRLFEWFYDSKKTFLDAIKIPVDEITSKQTETGRKRKMLKKCIKQIPGFIDFKHLPLVVKLKQQRYGSDFGSSVSATVLFGTEIPEVERRFLRNMERCDRAHFENVLLSSSVRVSQPLFKDYEIRTMPRELAFNFDRTPTPEVQAHIIHTADEVDVDDWRSPPGYVMALFRKKKIMGFDEIIDTMMRKSRFRSVVGGVSFLKERICHNPLSRFVSSLIPFSIRMLIQYRIPYTASWCISPITTWLVETMGNYFLEKKDNDRRYGVVYFNCDNQTKDILETRVGGFCRLE